jgi:competence protein ComEA
MKKAIGSLLLLASFIASTAYAAVNINTATQSELEAVKGLGPSKAKAILEYREKQGNFRSVDELDNVKGFGKASINKLRSELTVEADK